MKAWVFFQKGNEELTKETNFPIPKIKGGYDVLVRVLAAGLNPIDGMKSSYDIPFPAVAGTDCCGIVEQIGGSVDESEIAPGKLVFFVHGIDQGGTFADYIVHDARAMVAIPEELYVGHDINKVAVTFAGLPKVTTIAFYDMIVKAGLSVFPSAHPSVNPTIKNIVITGASGGVGSYCLQFAKLYRVLFPKEVQPFIRIIAIASSSVSHYVTKYGATHVIDYKTEDVKKRVMEITDDQGADVYIDNIGDTNQGINCLGFNGVYVSNLPFKEDYDLLTQIKNQISLQRVNIIHNYYIGTEDLLLEMKGILEVVLNLLAEGKLVTIPEEVISFDEIKDKLMTVKQKHNLGKIIAVVNDA